MSDRFDIYVQSIKRYFPLIVLQGDVLRVEELCKGGASVEVCPMHM